MLRALRTPANCSWFVRLGGRDALRDDVPGQQCDPVPVELRAKPSIDLLIEVAPDFARSNSSPRRSGSKRRTRLGEQGGSRDGGDDREDGFADDPKERRAALNAMLKPLVDRAVAACGEPRQTALRSDEAGEKLASAQVEGGYWLAPLEDAANHWAVESRGSAHRL